MKILIDFAEIEGIKEMYEFYPVDGVTTNPTILKKSERKPYEVLKEIRAFIGAEAELHVQVISLEAEGMIEEGHKLQKELGKNTFIKIPVTKEGLKAIRHLSNEGANVTGTAIYTSMQGYLAAKAGAKYVAPYVNRIDNLGYSGISVAKQIHEMIKKANLNCGLLAASFKNSQQVIELCEYGADAVTISPDVVEGLIKSEVVTKAIEVFVEDFEKLCGPGKTQIDCE